MQNIRFHVLRTLLLALGALPLRFHYRAARFISWVLRCVVQYRKTVVTVNLSRSFPELNTKQIQGLVKDFYDHISDLIAEVIWFCGCRNPQRFIRQNLVSIVNPDEINRIFNSSKSLVSMFGHVGNWELLSAFPYYNTGGVELAFGEDDIAVVYKAMKDEAWNRLLQSTRLAPLKSGVNFEGYLETRQILRYAITHSSEKKMYNLLSDQRPYSKTHENMKVNFMGRECGTMSGGAALAHKFGMGVVYMSMRRAGRGHYEIEFKLICENASQMSTDEIMQRYYELLENDIKAQPENYLWSHRRWR